MRNIFSRTMKNNPRPGNRCRWWEAEISFYLDRLNITQTRSAAMSADYSERHLYHDLRIVVLGNQDDAIFPRMVGNEPPISPSETSYYLFTQPPRERWPHAWNMICRYHLLNIRPTASEYTVDRSLNADVDFVVVEGTEHTAKYQKMIEDSLPLSARRYTTSPDQLESTIRKIFQWHP